MNSDSNQEVTTTVTNSGISNSETLNDVLKKAKIAYEDNNYVDAIECCSVIINEYDCYNKEAFLLMMKILIERNEYELANELRKKIEKEVIGINGEKGGFKDVFLELEMKIREYQQRVQFMKDKKIMETVSLFMSNGWVNLTVTIGMFLGACYLLNKAKYSK